MGGLEDQRSLLPRSDDVQGEPAQTILADVPVYEELLTRDPRWALSEGSRHFEEDSAVFKALHRIAQRLKALEIPYVVVGGMALFRHGLRRFTEDVDILVTKDGLKQIHERLDGLGYVPPFPKSKHLRDVELGVKIEFLTTGDFPGDGKKKPVSFPDPSTVVFESDGINYVNLPKLVELKLASGMTSPGRLKDLADVLELTKILDLPREFADQLDPYVRDKFAELWKQARKRYIRVWHNKRLSADAKSIEDMIASDRSAADEIDQLRRDGVVLEADRDIDDGQVYLVTSNPRIAEKYGLVEESEYWSVDENEGEQSPSTDQQR